MPKLCFGLLPACALKGMQRVSSFGRLHSCLIYYSIQKQLKYDCYIRHVHILKVTVANISTFLIGHNYLGHYFHAEDLSVNNYVHENNVSALSVALSSVNKSPVIISMRRYVFSRLLQVY